MVNYGIYRDPHFAVDFQRRMAWLDGREMTLTRKEYQLMLELVRHAGEIVPRDVLLKNVWEYGPEIRTRTLDVHIRRLRRKLGDYAESYIETIFGVGYRFQPCREANEAMKYAAVLRATA
jgi:DNA-binding response OmpR family regulator